MINTNYDTDALLAAANIARRASMILAESVYKYLGGLITRSDLEEIVNSVISEEHSLRFKHMYILKDTYDDYLGSMLAPEEFDVLEDDTDTINIIEGGEM